jgi:hypothetical protein
MQRGAGGTRDLAAEAVLHQHVRDFLEAGTGGLTRQITWR